MSGAKPTGGPERPKEEVEQVPALYKEGGMAGIQHSMLPKVLLIASVAVIGLMLVLALLFCLVGGVKNKQPRYFLLMVNLILSAAITGLLIFWYFRGTLVSSLLWYIFVQCIFLFFQCITTDIFAWYETKTASEPWRPISTNCTQAGCTIAPPNTTHSPTHFAGYYN